MCVGGGALDQSLVILFYFGCAGPTVGLKGVLSPSPFWQVAAGPDRQSDWWSRGPGTGCFVRQDDEEEEKACRFFFK